MSSPLHLIDCCFCFGAALLIIFILGITGAVAAFGVMGLWIYVFLAFGVICFTVWCGVRCVIHVCKPASASAPELPESRDYRRPSPPGGPHHIDHEQHRVTVSG